MQDTSSPWQFIETAAAQMGVNGEALRKWRERGRVPYRWRLPILDAAKAEHIELPPEIFDQGPARPEGAAA